MSEQILRIDNEFKTLIPPITGEEYEGLEQKIMNEGFNSKLYGSLIAWDGALIDGHNRYEICMKLEIPFEVEEMHFDSREAAKEWIIKNQFGRRNLTPYQRSVLALKLKPLIQAKAKAKMLSTQNNTAGAALQNSVEQIPEGTTQKALAKIAGVSHDTIYKVEQIQKKATDEVKEKVRSGEMSIAKGYLSTKEDATKTDKPVELGTEEMEAKNCAEPSKKAALIKIDDDQLFREMTEIVPVNQNHSYIVKEIEEILNRFLSNINQYSYKGYALNSLTFEEKQSLLSTLMDAESQISLIKKLMEE
jgi:hypothetical protein